MTDEQKARALALFERFVVAHESLAQSFSVAPGDVFQSIAVWQQKQAEALDKLGEAVQAISERKE